MTRDSHRPEWRARSAIDRALQTVGFSSTKAKAKVSSALEERLHEPVSQPTPRLSVEVSSSQVDEAVLDTIDDVEASLKELRALNMAAKSVAVPPLKCGNAADNMKHAFILSPKLTSTSHEEQVQRAKSESAAREQWHQQRRRQQEQQQQAAASDALGGTRQKLRRGSQEHPGSHSPGASVHGGSSSSLASVEFQRLSETDARGGTLEQQRARGQAPGGTSSSRSSLEQREGAAGAARRNSSTSGQHIGAAARRGSTEEQPGRAAARRGSLQHREGARASRRNSSMESLGGPMSRKSCPLSRFEATSPAPPPDHAPPAPCDASNPAPPPPAKDCMKGGALANQHHEAPPPLAPPHRRRSSLPEYLVQGTPPAPPPDHAPPAPCDASNTAPLPTAKGCWKGFARAQKHQQQLPPYVPPLRRRSSLPEYLMQGASPVDEGQHPFMLSPPEPSSSATSNCTLPQSSSGPLTFARGDGRPLPGRFSQLQLRTDLSSPPPSLSPSSPMTAPNTLASSSPSSSGPLSGTFASRSWHASVTLDPMGGSSQHQHIPHSKSSGLLSSLQAASSATKSEQALQALKPSTPTSQSGPLQPLPPTSAAEAQYALLTTNPQHSLRRPEQQLGSAACASAAAGDEGLRSAQDASAASAPPPVKGRFMFATQSSINRAEGTLAKSESAKRRSSRTGHRLSHSTSSGRRRVKRNPSSRSLITQGSGTGKRASSNGRHKGVRSRSSFTRKGVPSKTASQRSLMSSASRNSSMRSKDSGRSRTSSVNGSHSGSDTPSVSSVVSSVAPAPGDTPSQDSVPAEPSVALPGMVGDASAENSNKGAPLQPSMPGFAAAPAQHAHFAGFPATKRTTSLEHASSASSSTSASLPPAAAAPRACVAHAEAPVAGGSSAEGADCSKSASKSVPRKRAPTKQPSNVRFNLPAVAPPRSPHPPEEPAPSSHSGRPIAIPEAPKSKSSPTTAASSPKDPALPAPGTSAPSRASSAKPSIPAITALAKDALAEVPSTLGKISKQTGNLRQYLAGNRLDVSRLDLDTYLKKLDNENKTRSRSVGRFAGNKKQGGSKSSNEHTLLQQRGACAGEGDPSDDNGVSGPASEQAAGSRIASMFAQLGQEEQELQELHKRMRTAANRSRAHGVGTDQRSLWRG
ncbi:hypothetical protein DUNSADRAFT_567 [Dunaliella salina]|uniref:Uncharacterized protein n=1 Tax=Dunaliella salina TaxID=3046 RepID=A0ABQ7FYP6_DUNSA|nr:hypothetical protein DUNSADRAFT_567 [Dunaliella salina]|eukprot:KAF5827484.1 hypothetical protein DUNSADRAFT_567 [Dunaliella salina]